MADGDIFAGHSGGLQEAGQSIEKAASNFEKEYERIYQIIDALIGSEWSSPGASVIAKKIEEQRPNLIAMKDAIRAYSSYCFRTADRVETNEDNIISGVGGING